MKRLAILTVTVALFALPGQLTAGPNTGVFSGNATLNGYTTATWVVICRAGENTTFEVKGNQATDMDLLVLDSEGKLIVQTSGPGDHCRLTWYSPANERVFVLLINRGQCTNSYSYSAK